MAKPRLLHTSKKVLQVSLVAMVGTVLSCIVPATALAAAAVGSTRDSQFAAAAAEFKVPRELLLAISYNQSRWENHKGQASASGGYGLMHLVGEAISTDGRGKHIELKKKAPASSKTLTEAAQLINVSEDILKKDDVQNIRGAAALLAKYAKAANGGNLPDSLDGWSSAVAALNGSTDRAATDAFTDDVYATLRDGVSSTTTDGQTLTLPKQQVVDHLGRIDSMLKRGYGNAQEKTECPPTISCRFVPARFMQNNPNDPLDYGNYDIANRPDDMKIKYIIIHDTEGSYNSAISWFQDPRSYVSANYVIRSKDGAVTQMVKNKDVAWHAGNWYMNMHSIGIEHEGFASEGSSWYTEAMYRSSAKLVRYLANKYNIPLDRDHIIGHEQYSAVNAARQAGMHTDPGPYWDWQHYMELIGAKTPEPLRKNTTTVTIAPRFRDNKPEVTECIEGTCTTLAKQAANFVHIRTAPDHTAALVTDAALHPDGMPGTTDIADTSAKAFYGQRFVLADKQGDWTAIWFNGQKGWFYNPAGDKRTALPTRGGRIIAAKPGATTVPLYGRPLPEDSAYKNGVPKQPLAPLQYTLIAGQRYYAYDKQAKNDYYHVLTFDYSTPGELELVVGNEKYIPISYNHRQMFVKASDVQIINE